MNLRVLALAALAPLFPSSGTAEENSSPKSIEERVDQLEDSREDRLNLGLEYGWGYSDGITSDVLGASLGINGYLVLIRFREERSGREEPDILRVSNLELQGTRESRRYNADIGFGYAFLQKVWRWADLSLHGHILGSIQLDTSMLRAEGDDIPGPVYIDFLLGGGVRGEAAIRIPSRWTYLPLSVGVGAAAEYLRTQVQKITEEAENGFSGVGYFLLRISRKRE